MKSPQTYPVHCVSFFSKTITLKTSKQTKKPLSVSHLTTFCFTSHHGVRLLSCLLLTLSFSLCPFIPLSPFLSHPFSLCRCVLFTLLPAPSFSWAPSPLLPPTPSPGPCVLDCCCHLVVGIRTAAGLGHWSRSEGVFVWENGPKKDSGMERNENHDSGVLPTPWCWLVLVLDPESLRSACGGQDRSDFIYKGHSLQENF